MSYDVYFVPRPAAQHWPSTLHQLDQAVPELQPLDDTMIRQWSEIVLAVRPLLPGVEEFTSEHHGELDYDDLGMQLIWPPPEFRLSLSYGQVVDDAVLQLMERVVRAVEDASGLEAYDPQSQRPFLATDASTIIDSFEAAQRALDQIPGIIYPAPRVTLDDDSSPEG